MVIDDTRSTFSRELKLLGYVVDEPALRRVDAYSTQALAKELEADANITQSCVASTKNEGSAKFESVDALIAHFAESREIIKDLRIDYQTAKQRIEVFFDGDGTIKFSAYGPAPEFHFVAEGLDRVLKQCDPDYHWLARMIAFSRKPRRLLAFFIPLLSVVLLSQSFYYFYATRIGVDINPALLYEDNTYYQDVERAIESPSLEDKLDTLLKGELKGFTNVTQVLETTQLVIGALVAALVVLGLGIAALRSFSNAYPRAFFAIGLANQQLSKLERKREVWAIGVAIAFAVNLVAGSIVALLW